MSKQSSSPTLYLFGELNYESSNAFIQALHEADQLGTTISIWISSGGGDVDAGIACYDAIRSTKSHVLTVCSGMVGSAAVLPFIAGDARIMQPNGRLFFHEVRVSIDSEGLTPKDLQKLLLETELVTEKYVQLVSEASKLTPKQVEALCGKETYISVQEAIKLGLADGEYTKTSKKQVNQRSALDRAVVQLVNRRNSNVK